MDTRIGVVHYNFPDMSFEEFCAWCRHAGCTHVEVMNSDVIAAGTDARASAKKRAATLSSTGLASSQFYAANDFAQPDKKAFRAQLDTIRKCCELAHLLGTNQLRIDGGRQKEGLDLPAAKELIRRGIEESVGIAEEADVYLALDNHGDITNDHTFQLELFREIGSGRLGANLDTANYRWYGYSVEELPGVYREIAPYVRHTHFKDGTGDRSVYKGAALGDGEVPLASAVQALRDAGYQGVWCAEYEGPELAGGVGYGKCVRWLKGNAAP